jgi:hypothetical protein
MIEYIKEIYVVFFLTSVSIFMAKFNQKLKQYDMRRKLCIVILCLGLMPYAIEIDRWLGVILATTVVSTFADNIIHIIPKKEKKQEKTIKIGNIKLEKHMFTIDEIKNIEEQVKVMINGATTSV